MKSITQRDKDITTTFKVHSINSSYNQTLTQSGVNAEAADCCSWIPSSNIQNKGSFCCSKCLVYRPLSFRYLNSCAYPIADEIFNA